MERYDVTVVGGGPVGMFGATLALIQGLRTQIIESLPQLGGQMTALYPEKFIYDVPGFAAVSAADLADALAQQMRRYAPTVHLGETVEQVWEVDGAYVLKTSRSEHRTKAILIAAGLGAFQPRRLTATGADRFEGRGVYYVPPAMAHFHDLEVVVVGGGDTAVDWALAIAQHARRVVVVHRRVEFRAQADGLRRLAALPHVEFVTPYEVVEVLGDGAVTGVRVREATGASERIVPAQAVVGGLGFHAQLGPIRSWDLRLQGHHIVVDPSSMETSRPGIYAVGDIASYPGKVRLIATGFGEIGIAVEHLRRYVHPHLTGSLPHSTTLRQPTDTAQQFPGSL